MAFFKTRKSGDEPAATPIQPDSVEVIRRRARHRLIGSAALVLVGVVGFPLLFDQQPRPVALDVAIDIPERAKAPTVAAPAPAAQPIIEEKEAPSPVVAASSASKIIAEVAPPKAVPASPAPALPPATASPKPAPAPAPVVDESAKPKALLEGREPPAAGSASAPASATASAAAAAGRYVVQVGAYAEAARAQEVRGKLERAGLKTYTHVAESKEGRRIRVRVGPFADKAEATKAAARIKQLDLPAAILTL
ncbi:MAG: SPOR domain-containing protein [Betaproteobacteria bacterium]